MPAKFKPAAKAKHDKNVFNFRFQRPPLFNHQFILETLRRIRMNELNKLLKTRLTAAPKSRDLDSLKLLGAEEENWYRLASKIMLPAFLRNPPPVFSMSPADQSIRVLGFGDFGSGSPEQKQLAAAMLSYHKRNPFSFGLTLADNFYSIGVSSLEDPQWKAKWEDMYGRLGISGL